MMRINCLPYCCSIDGGECKPMDALFTFTGSVSFSKAFHKPPTLSATSPVIEFDWGKYKTTKGMVKNFTIN